MYIPQIGAILHEGVAIALANGTCSHCDDAARELTDWSEGTVLPLEIQQLLVAVLASNSPQSTVLTVRDRLVVVRCAPSTGAFRLTVVRLPRQPANPANEFWLCGHLGSTAPKNPSSATRPILLAISTPQSEEKRQLANVLQNMLQFAYYRTVLCTYSDEIAENLRYRPFSLAIVDLDFSTRATLVAETLREPQPGLPILFYGDPARVPSWRIDRVTNCLEFNLDNPQYILDHVVAMASHPIPVEHT